MDRASLLRTTYRINAAATLACGLALMVFAESLSPIFAVPATALWRVGALFLPFAVAVFAVSRRVELRRSEAAIVGVLDAVYALASFAAVAELWARMTPELRIAIALVAAPVAVFAAIELSFAFRLRGSPAIA